MQEVSLLVLARIRVSFVLRDVILSSLDKLIGLLLGSGPVIVFS